MARKHKPEDIIGKRREGEIVLAYGEHLQGLLSSQVQSWKNSDDSRGGMCGGIISKLR